MFPWAVSMATRSPAMPIAYRRVPSTVGVAWGPGYPPPLWRIGPMAEAQTRLPSWLTSRAKTHSLSSALLMVYRRSPTMAGPARPSPSPVTFHSSLGPLAGQVFKSPVSWHRPSCLVPGMRASRQPQPERRRQAPRKSRKCKFSNRARTSSSRHSCLDNGVIEPFDAAIFLPHEKGLANAVIGQPVGLR